MFRGLTLQNEAAWDGADDFLIVAVGASYINTVALLVLCGLKVPFHKKNVTISIEKEDLSLCI